MANEDDFDFVDEEFTDTRYDLLIDQYAQSAQQKSSALIKRGDPFNVDGINFSLRYLPEIAPDAITICATVLDGKQNIDDKTVSWLLDANLQLHRNLGPVIALAPVTHDVIMMFRVSLTRATAASFDKTLKKMAADAFEWRKKIADRKQTVKKLAI